MKQTAIGYTLPISTVGERCHAFVPHLLPPQPPLQINANWDDLIDNTLMALG